MTLSVNDFDPTRITGASRSTGGCARAATAEFHASRQVSETNNGNRSADFAANADEAELDGVMTFVLFPLRNPLIRPIAPPIQITSPPRHSPSAVAGR